MSAPSAPKAESAAFDSEHPSVEFLRTELFGQSYAAPFGVAPIGLQGLMWPRLTANKVKSRFVIAVR